MSQVKIQGNASGTGIFTIASPNSNTDRTLTLPDQTGTVVTSDASGNVGIGTSSPDDITSGYTTVDVRGSTGGGLRLGVSGGNNMAIYASATTSVIEAAGSAALQLVTNGSERARITSGGDLLVGTTTLNTGDASISFSGTDFYQSIRRPAGASRSMIFFYNGGTSVGEIRTSTTATSYITSSDYRLKENVQPMIGAIARVALLKPVTYKWKANGSDGQGFIAHELAKVCPDAVSGDKDAVDEDGNPVYQGIDTSFLVATLTAAIQEQQALIESLTARIAALEGAN